MGVREVRASVSALKQTRAELIRLLMVDGEEEGNLSSDDLEPQKQQQSAFADAIPIDPLATLAATAPVGSQNRSRSPMARRLPSARKVSKATSLPSQLRRQGSCQLKVFQIQFRQLKEVAPFSWNLSFQCVAFCQSHNHGKKKRIDSVENFVCRFVPNFEILRFVMRPKVV
jgi:hypothetical protein